MFTGLIKDIGLVESILPNASGVLLGIKSSKLIDNIEIDDSIAINGVCQTAVKKMRDIFFVQAVHGTLNKTTLGQLRQGHKVNLELALQLSDRLGGHLVQGHVNGIARLRSIEKNGESSLLEFNIPSELIRYFVDEGSITIDGVSLTVFKVKQTSVVVSIIPHTLHNTTLFLKKIGDEVNIEVDILAKYVERLFPKQGNNKNSDSQKVFDLNWLGQNGF